MNILNTLTEIELVKISNRSYSKGDIIAHEGDRCEGIFVVTEGKVQILSYSLSGKEIVYNEIGENEMFGNNLVFSTDPVYKGNVIAVSEVALSYIYNKDILDLLRTNESFALAYLRAQSDFGKSLNQKIKLLSFDNAEDRLLFYLAEHHGKIKFDSVTSLSKELFLQRETLSRLIHRLADQGRVKMTNNSIELVQ